MARVLLLLVAVAAVMAARAAADDCSDSDEISCRANSRCIPMHYICDGDDDCDDDADEDSDLCRAWRSSECDSGRVQCRRGGSESCVSMTEYCSFTNPPCQGDLDLRICQMLKDNEVKKLEDIVVTSVVFDNNLQLSERLGQQFSLLMNNTIDHPRCPPMYTLVGDQCFSLFFIGSVSWGEARAFCQMLRGELLTFHNISHYTALVAHLRDAQVTSDFWVGGRYLNTSGGWTWTNETPMELGTPYWAVRYQEECQQRFVNFPQLEEEARVANNGECYHYVQAPRSHVQGQCVALTYNHHYFMSDEDCLERKSPLCVLSDPAAFNNQLPL